MANAFLTPTAVRDELASKDWMKRRNEQLRKER
jgi:hypothetical protein